MAPGAHPAGVLYRQVLKEVFFLCLFLLVLHFKAQDSQAMSLWVAAMVRARVLLIGQTGDGWCFLVGLLAGGGNDILSMVKGVYRYLPDHVWKEKLDLPSPPWMVVFWGWVFTAFRHLFLLPLFRPPRGWRPGAKRFALDLATAIALRLVIYNTVRQEPLPTLGFAAVLGLRLMLLPPRPHEWRLMAVVIAIGPAFEAILIQCGLYEYDDPVFWGMPVWLLMYWSFALPLLMKGVFHWMEPAGRPRPWGPRFGF